MIQEICNNLLNIQEIWKRKYQTLKNESETLKKENETLKIKNEKLENENKQLLNEIEHIINCFNKSDDSLTVNEMLNVKDKLTDTFQLLDGIITDILNHYF